jgi:outer membrane receptor protein involved in Fe transport
VKFEYKSTSFLLAYDYQQITRPSNSTGVVTPDGDIFKGAGRDNLFLPPGANETFTHRGVRAMLLHAFSPDWELRIVPGMNIYDRLGSIVLTNWGVNYDTRQVGLMNRRNDQTLEHYNVALDVNGRYALLGHKLQSTFGVNLSNNKTVNVFWISNDFGTPGRGLPGVGQQLWISMDNPQIDSIRVKPIGDYVPPSNPGSSVNAYYGSFFFQQIAEIIPNRLSLTAGISYYSNETFNNQNLAVFPPVSATVSSYTPQHRVGFVFNITHNIRLYGIDSTTSLPPSAFKTQDGSVLPPAEGKGKEFGFKATFWDERIYTAAGVFDYTTSGGSGGQGGILPNGETFVLKAGTRRAKGWDIDLAFRLTSNWQLLANYFSAGGATDDRGNPVPEYASSTWSFFTRYNLPKYRFSFGGGANQSKGRSITSSGLTYVGRPTRIPLKDAPLVNTFANYRFNDHVSVNLNVANVFDESFVLAAVTASQVAPTQPRTITLSGVYKF